MDACFARRSEPRPSPRLRRTPLVVVALLLYAAGVAAAQAPRFGVHASLQPKAATPSGGGFELRARLTPATHPLQGGGYSVDAIAATAASCGVDDKIFANGFELRIE